MQGTGAGKYASQLLKASCASYARRARAACFVPVMARNKPDFMAGSSFFYVLARFWADFLAAIEKQPGFYREPYFTHSPSMKRVVLVDSVRILEGLSTERVVLVDRV